MQDTAAQPALSGTRFLVAGRAGMDLYADPPGTTIEEAVQFSACLGGSSANIAAGLVRLGASADLMTSVSDDAVGRFALSQLDAYGIGRAHVRQVGGEARNSLAVVETRLHNTQSVIYRNGAADFEMTAEDVARPDYGAYDALVTTGTVLAAEPSRSAAFDAFARARAAGSGVVFDIDYRPYSWASPAEAQAAYGRAAHEAGIIVGNDVEFGFLAGGHDQGLAAARALAGQGKLVVYKMGPEGAITLWQGQELRTGTYPTEPLKPTGAGDAFMAGFLSALGTGRPVPEAVLRGSAAAAIVVARPGCAPAMPLQNELEDFLGRHAPPILSQEQS